MKEKRIINLAVQVLPQSKTVNTYDIVDKAIEVIQKSGIKHLVCPFETVLEGEYDEIMLIVKDLQEACFDAGAESLITNIKIQQSANKDVSIEDKIGKYS